MMSNRIHWHDCANFRNCQ